MAVRVITKATDAGPRYFVYVGTTRIGAGYQDKATALRVAQAARQVRKG